MTLLAAGETNITWSCFLKAPKVREIGLEDDERWSANAVVVVEDWGCE